MQYSSKLPWSNSELCTKFSSISEHTYFDKLCSIFIKSNHLSQFNLWECLNAPFNLQSKPLCKVFSFLQIFCFTFNNAKILHFKESMPRRTCDTIQCLDNILFIYIISYNNLSNF